MSGGNPVFSIAVSGRVLAAPACLLIEGSAYGRWVRGPAVEVVFADFSWISWFGNWVCVKIRPLRGSKLSLTLSSTNSIETPVMVSPVLLALRTLNVSMMFTVLTSISGCILRPKILPFLRVLHSERKPTQFL